MGTYKFLPHTADEKFQVSADSLDDAFATSVKAFYEILLGKDIIVAKNVSKKIHLKAKKLRYLLYDFLNELVFYFDDERLLLSHVISLKIAKQNFSDGEEFTLEAELMGDKSYSYELLTEIKNMTYSEMEIKIEKEKVELTVVVDI